MVILLAFRSWKDTLKCTYSYLNAVLFNILTWTHISIKTNNWLEHINCQWGTAITMPLPQTHTNNHQQSDSTFPFSKMFFRRGRWWEVRLRKDWMPCLWMMATKYKESRSVQFHFMSGSRMNPVSGSWSSNTMRSASCFFSRMLWTHWNVKQNVKLFTRTYSAGASSRNHVAKNTYNIHRILV